MYPALHVRWTNRGEGSWDTCPSYTSQHVCMFTNNSVQVACQVVRFLSCRGGRVLVTKYSNFLVQPTLIIINISMPGVRLQVATPAHNSHEYCTTFKQLITYVVVFCLLFVFVELPLSCLRPLTHEESSSCVSDRPAA